MYPFKFEFIFCYTFSFLDTNTPLHILIEAAKSGNEKEVDEYAQVFSEHARKLVEVFLFKYSYLSFYLLNVLTYSCFHL